jgi:3-phenylpropionate/trans-cinnamate dioxygenase ferredoxin subunit
MARHVVCPVEELPPGARKEVEVKGRSICVFNADGRHYAIRNTCPHQGAPLCAGSVGGTMLASEPKKYVYAHERRILRCAWHGWEFDLETGGALFDPRIRVKTYPVSVENGSVVVDA